MSPTIFWKGGLRFYFQASLRTALRLIREHEDEIRIAWKKHFRR